MKRENCLQRYYRHKAQEYEQIYHRNDSVRQSEQGAIAAAIAESFCNRDVLEIACGTGFWTQIVAEVAQHIVAIDILPEMVTIARNKGLSPDKVDFCVGDAYTLQSVSGKFNAGLANFWLSHVPKARMDEFLRGFHERLTAGAIVFMADNVYVPRVGGELVTHIGNEDTFKLRELSDGSQYEVLKNYYGADQLDSILASRATDLQVYVGRCFWWSSYRVV